MSDPKSAEETRHKDCGGTLFNVTPDLILAMGGIHVQCDKCGEKFGFVVSEEYAYLEK